MIPVLRMYGKAIDAIQASNDAPKTVWGEDFWNRFTAEDFVPTGKALAYYNAVSATKCWEGEIVEPDPGEYNVTVQIEGDGTVTGNDSPYEPGDEVELVASANAGSEFKGWQVVEDDSNSVSEPSGADPNFNFTMPANDVTVKAIFEKQAPPTKYKFTVKNLMIVINVTYGSRSIKNLVAIGSIPNINRSQWIFFPVLK